MRLAHILRHKWEALATRTGLRLLPPVGTALAVLAAGVLIPFVPKVDALPPQFAPSLAASRIARFLRTHVELPEGLSDNSSQNFASHFCHARNSRSVLLNAVASASFFASSLRK